MKKVLIGGALVAGLFLSACGENLPKEIKEHASYEECKRGIEFVMSISKESNFNKKDEIRKCVETKKEIREIKEAQERLRKENRPLTLPLLLESSEKDK